MKKFILTMICLINMIYAKVPLTYPESEWEAKIKNLIYFRDIDFELRREKKWSLPKKVLTDDFALKIQKEMELIFQEKAKRNFSSKDVDLFFWKMNSLSVYKADKKIKEAGKNYMLFFLFNPLDNAYVDKAIPTVKAFKNLYDWSILGITPTGNDNGEFPEIEIKKDMGCMWNMEGGYPSLFLVNPKKQTFKKITTSFDDFIEIKNYIYQIILEDEENN